MRTINIGKLNKRLVLMKLKETEDEMGQITNKLCQLKTVWGSLYPIRGAEKYEAEKIQSKITHKCYIRYNTEVDSNCFIMYDGKTYNIESVIDINMEHKLLEIMCEEHINKEEMPYGNS